VYGVDKYWVLVPVVQEWTLLKNNKHSFVDLTNNEVGWDLLKEGWDYDFKPADFLP
jgi:hypothetical protein